MTRKKLILIVACILLTALSTTVSSQKRGSLNADQQKKLLAHRLPTGVVAGTFDSFTSLLFSLQNIALHTNDKEINETELHSPFPDFYRPTVKELLATIALQTKSSWTYDAQNNYWVFAKPATAKPFSLTLADDWNGTDRGSYVSYRPSTYPVGMDVYYYGSYSSDEPSQQALMWERIRNLWATTFASRLKRGVSISEMQAVPVDGVEALYFQSPTSRPGVMWRQWALVKNGQAFVIVSTLPADDKKLLADLEAMVKSFRVRRR